MLGCETLPLTESFFELAATKAGVIAIAAIHLSQRQQKRIYSHPITQLFIQGRSRASVASYHHQNRADPAGLTHVKKTAQRQRYLEMISTQCDRQKSLINGIINLLKIQTTPSPERQPIQLADIIPGIVSTYQPIAEERGIMLAYTIPPNLKAVLGVEPELKEVVIHLINNGIEITPKGGRLWVAATPHEGDLIALTVQDSGAGISPSEITQLFEPFYRNVIGKDGNTGSGLGLTLVQQLFKANGWQHCKLRAFQTEVQPLQCCCRYIVSMQRPAPQL